jgi:uncharacterized protein with FMN-binding domain
MIFGIPAAVLLIVVCLRFAEKRFIKKSRVFLKLHAPASILLVIVAALHICTAIPLFASRPLYVLITGILCLALIILAIYSGHRIRKGSGARRLHRLSALFAFICVILHIAMFFLSFMTYQNRINNVAISGVDVSAVPDGVYIGECDVTYIYARVEVKIKSGEIADIVILEHRNERGEAAESVVNNILEQQKIEVDTVSGATNSSIVIIKAVENALSNTGS